MSDSSTSRMLESLEVASTAPMFLSSQFRSPPENYFNSEKVEMDIIREDEEIAVPVQDITSGARHNENNKYTNKAYTPPIIRERGAIVAWEQLKRQAGQNPFEDPNFARSAGSQARTLLDKLGRKGRRTVELMAAQVFQLGIITLVDSAGATVYTCDFSAKVAHMATVSTSWALDGSTGSPLADISALARVVRRNGKRKPNKLIFGSSAIQRFLANADVQEQLDKTKLNLGVLNPAKRNEDGTYYGTIWIDNYDYEIWLYDGFYKHPQTGTITPYIDDDNVIMTSTGARLDLAFGAVPSFAPPNSGPFTFLNGRMSSPGGQLDMQAISYLTNSGAQLFVEAAMRPLTIPSEIDSFARLNVTA